METKEILNLLGYSGDESLEGLKTFISDNFINRNEVHKDSDIVKSIVGKRVGDINTQLAKLFDYKHNELRDKSVEDTLVEIKEKYESKYNELKESSKEGTDKRLIDLQSAMEEKEKSIHSYKQANDELKQAVDAMQNEMKDFKKNTTINSIFSEIKRNIPLKDGITPVEQVGFDTMFQSKYQLDLDDENLVIKSKDGEFIKGEKPGAFATPDEVLKKELIENKLMKVNNADTTKKIEIRQNHKQESSGIFRDAL